MQQTLVAVFDSREHAEAARRALASTGITNDRIEVREGTLQDGSKTAVSADAPRDKPSFLERLFGLDDERDNAGQYAEAVRRGSCLVIVEELDESQIGQVSSVLEQQGAIDIDARVQNWRERGWSGYQADAAPLTGDDLMTERSHYSRTSAADTVGMMASGATGTGTIGGGTTGTLGGTTTDTMMGGTSGTTMGGTSALGTGSTSTGMDTARTSIPVVEEQLEIGKRRVEGGRVRIHTRVTEKPVEENVTLREERARVERHAVDRPATEADLGNAFREETVELRESAEQAVVAKTARVVEEVEIGTEETERTETVRDTIRRSDVEVEDVPASRTGRSGDSGTIKRP